MKPVTVEATVAKPPSEVFEFLDALANHERFLDHYLVDWTFSGHAARGRGQGAGAGRRARARRTTSSSR